MKGDPFLRAALICGGLGAGLLLTATTASCEERHSPKKFAWATVGTVVAASIDLTQTLSCLHAGRCVELNPAMRGHVLSGKIAANASVLTEAWSLRKHHSKLAWTILGTALASQSYAVASNARQLLRERK